MESLTHVLCRYYHNSDTGESVWEKPPDYNPEMTVRSHDPNWSKVESPGQATYYYHKETGKSVWERPKAYKPLSSQK